MIICSSRNASEYLLRAVFFGVCSRDLFFFFPLCHHGNTAKINYVCKVSFLTSNTLVAKYWIKGIIIFKYIWISFYIKKTWSVLFKGFHVDFLLSFIEWVINEYWSGCFRSVTPKAFRTLFYIAMLYWEATKLKYLPSSTFLQLRVAICSVSCHADAREILW